MRSEYDQAANQAPDIASFSITMVTASPSTMKEASRRTLGRSSQCLPAAAATHHYATSMMAASPSVACVQAFTPSQCSALGIPL